MDESFVVSVNAAHVWQGPIPAQHLSRLKSFARIGLKGFWDEYYAEQSSYQFVPADEAQIGITIESENEELYDIFDEEYDLRDFPLIEVVFDDKQDFKVNIPAKISLTNYVLNQVYVEIENVKRYFLAIDSISKSQDGFSQLYFEQGGFKCNIDLGKYGIPKSIESIYPVVIRGVSRIGSFEYLAGILFDKYYFSLPTLSNDGEYDLCQYSYFDEDFNFMMSFSQWFAGCEVRQIGEKYVSEISNELIDAYLSTNFHVYAEEEFVLNVGHFSKPLSDLHKSHGCDTSAVITAWNPLGVAQSDDENKKQNDTLKKIALERYTVIDAAGVDPKGEWPAEASFIILGISRHDAMEMGQRFRQNAIIFNEDKVPELVMLR